MRYISAALLAGVLAMGVALANNPGGTVPQAPLPRALVPTLFSDSMTRTGVLDGIPPAEDIFQATVVCVGLPTGTYDVGCVIQSASHPGGALCHFGTVTIQAGAILSVSGMPSTPDNFSLEPSGIYYATPLVYSDGTGMLYGARKQERTQRLAPAGR